MTTNTSYTMLGDKTIVPQADLENLVSAANRTGDTRKGGDSMGKKAGTELLMSATSDSTLKKVMSLGSLSSDAWRVVDGSANVTPVNLDPTNATWTKSAGCTYSANLLTADGTDDPTASQVVALKAGTYKFSLTAAYEGTLASAVSPDYHAPKLIISGATDGVLVTKTFTGANHATAAESASPKEEYAGNFTLTVDQNVTFKIDVVNEAGALEAGSAYIAMDLLQSA